MSVYFSKILFSDVEQKNFEVCEQNCIFANGNDKLTVKLIIAAKRMEYENTMKRL